MAEMVLGSVNLSTVESVHLSIDRKGDLKLEVTALAISSEGNFIRHKFEINLMGSAAKPFHKQEAVVITCDEEVYSDLTEDLRQSGLGKH